MVSGTSDVPLPSFINLQQFKEYVEVMELVMGKQTKIKKSNDLFPWIFNRYWVGHMYTLFPTSMQFVQEVS